MLSLVANRVSLPVRPAYTLDSSTSLPLHKGGLSVSKRYLRDC